MDTLLNFLADNFKWFMIGSGVLLIALIGFLVGGDKKKKKESEDALLNNAMQDAADNMETQNNQSVVAPEVAPIMAENVTPVSEPSLNFENESKPVDFSTTSDAVSNVETPSIGEIPVIQNNVAEPVVTTPVVETPIPATPVEQVVPQVESVPETPVVPIEQPEIPTVPSVEQTPVQVPSEPSIPTVEIAPSQESVTTVPAAENTPQTPVVEVPQAPVSVAPVDDTPII